MKKLLLLMICMLMNLTSWAFTAVNDDGITIYYTITNSSAKTVSVTYNSYSGNSAFSGTATYTGIINIPSSVEYNGDTYSVTGINSYAFYKDDEVTSVSLPNTITTIGDRAFDGCNSLSSINLPVATTIGSYAFNGCTSLTGIVLPAATSIGDSAFDGCNSLSSINLPVATSIGNSAFYGCTSLTGIVLPAATSIGERAFHGCTSLSSAELSAATSIGSNAFYGCKSLAHANLPVATSIGDWAFYGCTSLSAIELPAATSIGSAAFNNCSSLSTIDLSAVTSIGSSAFSYCKKINSLRIGSVEQWCNVKFENSSSSPLYDSNSVDIYIGKSEMPATNIEVPSTVTEIPNYAFKGTTISAISAPAVTSFGEKSFYGCSTLSTVYLPALTSVVNNAFSSCVSLSSIELPAATSIGSSAFYNCSSLTTIDLSSATSIGTSAFAYCREINSLRIGSIEQWCNVKFENSSSSPLYNSNSVDIYIGKSEMPATNIEVPSTVTEISDYAFKGTTISAISAPAVTSIGAAFNGCQSLTSVNLPSATSVGSYAFNNCSSLSTIDLSSAKSIGNSAFYNCSSLTSIELPAATSVEKSAFYNCTSLVSVDLPVATIIGVAAFDDCSSLASINVPAATTIGGSAFRGCTSLTFANLPSATSIGGSAFLRCNSLASAYIPAATSIGESAFKECGSLKDVDIYSVKTIGYYAFEGCSNISSLRISSIDQWLSIEVSANEGCHPLSKTLKSVDLFIGESETPAKDIEVPNTFTEIPAYAFKGTTIKSILAPTVSVISKSAFEGCSSLASLSLPAVKTIDFQAFYNCSNISSLRIGSVEQWLGMWVSIATGSHPLSATSEHVDLYIGGAETPATSLELPSSITSIAKEAFKNCYSLTSVTIPNTVTSIESSAFSGCSSLTSITCEGTTPPTVSNSDVFNAVTKTIPLYVPRESISAYKGKTGWDEFSNIKAIPNYELYLDDKTNLTGIEHVVPIYMNNIMEICNLQFDIVLPDNVDIYYGENDDEEEVYWVTKGERAKTAHTVAVSKNSANTYRVVMSSTSNAVFKETDRSLPIAYVRLNIDKYISEGSYKIELKNVKQTSYNNGVTSLINVPDASGDIVVPPSYSVIVSSSNTTYGTVKVEGEMYDATTRKTHFCSPVTMSSTPKTGYHFVEWTENNVTLSTENPYTLSPITANHTIKGVFAPNNYTVTFIVDGEIYSTGSQAYGKIVETPESPVKTGYSFVGWKNLTASTRVPANDVTYEAEFSINQYTVKFVADGQTIYEQKQDYNSDIIVPTAPEKERYAFVSWGDVLDKVPACDVTYTADYVLIGDLYEDLEINIGDLTSLVGIILDAAPDELDPHVFKKADIYQDNKINVADYTSLVGIILHGSNTSAKAKANVDDSMGDVAINMDNFHMTSADEGCISINFESPNKSIAALQFDLEIPSYMSFNVANVISQSANLKQSISYNLLDDSILRVMIYSANNSAIRAGKLMDINLASIAEGEHDITLKNIVCSTANNNVKELESTVYRISSSEITTIAATNTDGLNVKVEDSTMIIRSQKATPVKVVSSSGAIVAYDNISINKEMRISLPQGVYLVNGVKYIVK